MPIRDDSDDSDEEWDEEIRQREEKRRKHNEAQATLAVAIMAACTVTPECSDRPPANSPAEKSTTSRSTTHTKNIFVRDDSGNLVRMTPKLSPWYHMYVLAPRADDAGWLNKFRRRFRSPYLAYAQLVAIVRSVDSTKYFSRWTIRKHKCTKEQSPVELLVLGALRYLGRGWTFDDLEEATGIGEETHRVFFHKFLTFGSDILFRQFVPFPTSTDDAHCLAYNEAGMPGCVGSMDASHVLCERVPHDQAQEHKAFKINGTARTYNLVVNNNRKILSTTRGHPARWNDKTLVRYDKMATTLRYGKSDVLDNLPFELYERTEDGTVVSVKYKGAWLLVDNGYLNWSCTVPPMKTSTSIPEIRFSEWLESLRKDVECTFGILKGRFRVLKAGIRLHGIEACDNLWCTCCALHNMFLQYDGNDEDVWASDWGDFTEEDLDNVVPFAVQRLFNPSQIRAYDTSGNGRGNDYRPSNGQDDDSTDEDDDHPDNVDQQSTAVQLARSVDEDGCRCVRKLSLSVFRDKLVEHFDIAFSKNEIKWPTKQL